MFELGIGQEFFIFYMKALSKYNFPLLNKIFQLILRVISEIIKAISYPFRRIKRSFKRKFSKWLSLPRILLKEMKRYYRIISKKK